MAASKTLSSHRYFHNFAAMLQHCNTCEADTMHLMTLASMNKNFNNATRWKVCDVCGTQALAPTSEDLNRFSVS